MAADFFSAPRPDITAWAWPEVQVITIPSGTTTTTCHRFESLPISCFHFVKGFWIVGLQRNYIISWRDFYNKNYFSLT
jgi:hypothetical protein